MRYLVSSGLQDSQHATWNQLAKRLYEGLRYVFALENKGFILRPASFPYSSKRLINNYVYVCTLASKGFLCVQLIVHYERGIIVELKKE
jgi:hypothetical protein